MMFDNIDPDKQKAVNAAIGILNYSDNTEKKLREKLIKKGFSRDLVDYSIDYLKEKNILNEKRMIENEVRKAVEYKLYGKKRIIPFLYSKGFNRKVIEEFDWSDIDFSSICAKRIEKTANHYSDSQKLYASLLRSGFTSGEIGNAKQLLAQKEDD